MQPNPINETLKSLQRNIAEAEKAYDRSPNSVRLLGASKKQPVEKLLQATEAGLTLFGESYLQEALIKKAKLQELMPDANLEWHFIGPIQSNKTRKIAENFDWVQSISSKKIAYRLNAQRPVTLPPLNVCIEININEEETKSGVKMDEALELIQYCQTLPALKVRGLMAIPKIQTDFAAQREEFHILKELFDSIIKQGIYLDTLSMGMTEDYQAAIAEGSTLIRIGTGIFGPREEV